MKEPFYLTHLVIHLLRYLIIAGSAFLIFYILFSKKFGRNKIQEKVAKRKDFLRELFHSLQTVAIIALVGIGIVSSGLRDYTLFYDSLANYPIWWIPLSVFLPWYYTTLISTGCTEPFTNRSYLSPYIMSIINRPTLLLGHHTLLESLKDF